MEGGNPSEIRHHLHHLSGVDCGVIPANAVACLLKVATDHAVSHAADELIPRGVAFVAELHACLGSVVQKFVVPDPQGSVPGFIVCPTVVRGVGCSGHEVRSFVCCAYHSPSGGVVYPLPTSSPGVTRIVET